MSWTIKSTVSDSASALHLGSGKARLALVGRPLDERGRAAVEFCGSQCKDLVKMHYDSDSGRYEVNGISGDYRKVVDAVRTADQVIIECTTLGAVEIAQALRACRSTGVKSISALYVEPGDYKRLEADTFSDSREYHLSDKRKCASVTNLSIDLSVVRDGQAVFFIGYEDERLQLLLEEISELASFDKHVVIGTPAFEPGWELNCLANHADLLNDHKFDLHFAAANSVSAAYAALSKIHASHALSGNPTAVAPLGTKPHAIAAAMFLTEFPSFGQSTLLYDHPQKSAGRSTLAKRWHNYILNWSPSGLQL